MPLLRRLFWPLLLVPGSFAVAVFLLSARGAWSWLHAVALVLGPASFAALYAALRRSYRRWSVLPEGSVPDALVAPEEVVLISRGGFLTPGAATFTSTMLQVFAGGRPLLSLPLSRVKEVVARRGRVLRTPYVDFFAADGRRLARLGVEPATRWASALAAHIGGPQA